MMFVEISGMESSGLFWQLSRSTWVIAMVVNSLLDGTRYIAARDSTQHVGLFRFATITPMKRRLLLTVRSAWNSETEPALIRIKRFVRQGCLDRVAVPEAFAAKDALDLLVATRHERVKIDVSLANASRNEQRYSGLNHARRPA